MEVDETYNYLGIEEGRGIDNKLVKEYYRQVQRNHRTKLNSKNSITAVNTLAVIVSVYSFGIVNWLK